MDLISRQEAIDAIFDHEFPSHIDKGDVCTVLNDLPKVEAEPVRYGKWAKYYFDHVMMGVRPYMYYCTNCNEIGERTAFCPHCGAKMDERKEE